MVFQTQISSQKYSPIMLVKLVFLRFSTYFSLKQILMRFVTTRELQTNRFNQRKLIKIDSLEKYMKWLDIRRSFILAVCLLSTEIACAMSVGSLNVKSALGQPFKASLNVTLQAGEQLVASCISIIPPKSRNDDLPALMALRTTIESSGNTTRVIFSSTQTVNEPAIKIRVQIGCENPVQREFVVLLDPPNDKIQSKEETISSDLIQPNELHGLSNKNILAQTHTESSVAESKKEKTTAKDSLDGIKQSSSQQKTSHLISKKFREQNIQSSNVNKLPVSLQTNPLLESNEVSRSDNKTNSSVRSKKKDKLITQKGNDRLQLLPAGGDNFLPEISKQSGLRVETALQSVNDSLDRELKAPPLSAEKLEAIRREQRALIRYLRDESSSEEKSLHEIELEKKVSDLDKELATLRKSAQLAAAEKSNNSGIYLFGLAALIGFGLSIWFYVRIRNLQMHKLSEPWWDAQSSHIETNHSHDLDEWRHTESTQDYMNNPTLPLANKDASLSDGFIDTHAFLDSKSPESSSQIQTNTQSSNSNWSPSLLLDIPTHGPLPSFDVRIEELVHTQQLTQPLNDALPSITETSPATRISEKEIKYPENAHILKSYHADQHHESDSTSQESENTPIFENSNTLLVNQDELINGTIPFSPQKSEQSFNNDRIPLFSDQAKTEQRNVPSNYKAGLIDAILSFIDQNDEIRINYEQARTLQIRLSETANLLEIIEGHLSQNQIEDAITILQHAIGENKPRLVVPWLILFELYKRTDQPASYEALALGFQGHFGRAMQTWEEYDPEMFQIGLDEMPELMDRVWQHWGTPEGMRFLQRLCDNIDLPDEILFNRALAKDALNLAKIIPLQGEE